MTNFLLNLELKKVFQIIVGLVIVLLVAITALGTKQYFLYKHCRQAVAFSDQLLFGFTSIKEHISETLLTGGRVNVQEVSRDVQQFDKLIKEIGNDILIPREFKATFISQVDLVSMVVQLRAVQGSDKPLPRQIEALTKSLRSVNERLLHFHEALSAHTQLLLLGLNRVIIGTLALVVSLLCCMLLFMHRYISEPVLKLYRSAFAVAEDVDGDKKPDSIRGSIDDLDRLIHNTTDEKKRLRNLLLTLENARDTLPDQIDDPELWETLCMALQTNPDYLLVWIGLKPDEGNIPDPVTGCGCVSSSPVQCKQTINHLITFCKQEGSLCDSARQAAAEKRFIVTSTPVSSMPDALGASLPFNQKTVITASFPVLCGDNLLAVVTIYSPTPHCFARSETDILRFFFHQLGDLPGQPLPTEAVAIPAGLGLYRYSVLGALVAGLANEMVNTTNGALNYSQALLDLTADEEAFAQEHLLLEKLHQQEMKNAGLTGELTRLIETDAGKKNAAPEKMQITPLLERAIRLLQGEFKPEGIKVVIDATDQLPLIKIPGQTGLIILLTLLHRSAAYIKRSNELKKITVGIDTTSIKERKMLTLSLTPYPAGTEHNKQKQDSPWPDLSICSQMLQHIGGTLEAGEDAGKKQCTIALPVMD